MCEEVAHARICARAAETSLGAADTSVRATTWANRGNVETPHARICARPLCGLPMRRTAHDMQNTANGTAMQRQPRTGGSTETRTLWFSNGVPPIGS